jgi:hypothetical protein
MCSFYDHGLRTTSTHAMCAVTAKPRTTSFGAATVADAIVAGAIASPALHV